MMTPPSIMRLAYILITALVFIQGTAALTFEQAPLNPAFVAYTEGADAAAACYGTAGQSAAPAPAPFATGLLPSPAVVFWPDGYTTPVATDAAAFPARFDLREEGRVTPVRDQGRCGSCWAFATYGSLESTYLTDTGEAEDFSENNVKNLCSDEYEDGFDYGPCDGGVAFMSDAYLVRGSGPVQEADDPYILPMPSNVSPTDLPPVLDVREVTFLPQRTGPLDNDLFKEQLMQEGAIWVSFLVNWSCFADNYTTYYRPGDAYAVDGGHAVTLVGWDDAFPKESFAVEPPGDGAFILKNSWGSGVGEDGFFYISYYDPIIGTFGDEDQEFVMDYRNLWAAGAVYTGVPAEDGRRIYQYDPLGWTTSAGTASEDPLYGANVFTADGYEALTDVSFYTRGPEAGYTVAIFTNFTTPPGDAAPAAWTSGTCTLPGYHTISLPEAVPLTPGEVFSVVLAIDDPADSYPLVIEMPIEDYSSQATAGPGESYVSEDGGDTWDDLNDIFPNTNLCIKAFTHPLTVVPRDYATIQEAVTASMPGDTIIVEAGTYPEEIYINKTLTLLGMNGVVVATPADGAGILIEADNVTVAGFTFEGDGSTGAEYGMRVERDDCTIRDCRITGYEYGLWIPSAEGLTLSDIACYDNKFNLMYENPQADPGNAIAETVTVNGRPVIYREGISGETIDSSTNAGAVICVNCTDMTIRDTTTSAITYGYYLSGCEGITLENVTADAVGLGLGLLNSANVTVRDSTFGPDAEYGMLLVSVSNMIADGNEITCDGDGAGILLMLGDNVSIRDTTMTGGIGGVMAYFVFNGSVTGCTISETVSSGIEVFLGIGLAITNNTVHAPDVGIDTESVQDGLVSGNTLNCNDTGIGIVAWADGAEITANTANNCSAQAIMQLNDSVVYGNRFSGGAYPVIEATGGGGAVYVYRNDFVATETVPEGGILSASVAAEMPVTATDAMHSALCASACSIEDVLPDDWRPTGQFSAMYAAADTAAATNVTWHSPAPVSYWYRGQGFTETMGNHWSTYTGTDTTHDGIGDSPFILPGTETDAYPLVLPIEWYPANRPSQPASDDPAGDIAAAGTLSTGETATLRFTGSPVRTVALSAAEATGQVVLTVDPAPTGPAGLTGPVYSYLSVQLSGMTDDAVGGAAISFQVPAAWLKAEGLEPAEISLFRFHDSAWQELPTTLVAIEGGWATYEAETPGFSTFAIAEGTGDAIAIPVPGIVNLTVTEPEPTPEATAEPPVTVAMPGEATETTNATAATPQGTPSGLMPLIGGAAGAMLLFRKRE